MKDFTKAKKQLIIRIVIGVLAVFAVVVCVSGITGQIDIIKEGETSNVDMPKLSEESGFFQDEFDLTITVPEGTTVYYTLDGSDPDENSIRYEGPIHLKNATENKNVYSARTDVSAGFREDLIDKYPKYYESDVAPGYKVPDFKVDKCNVVRAVAVDLNGAVSETVTGSYFVGIDPEKYDGDNIISIVTDPENLFGYTKGIYVTGKIFDEYIKSDEIGRNYTGQRWKYWSANYRQHGSEWEREAMLTFFNKSGELVEAKDAGIRISGGCSRGIIPKSLNFYGRKKYDGEERFNTDFFGDGYKPDRMTLSGGGSLPQSQFNDFMMSQRVNGLNFTTMRFSPYVMFLDGEYWGFYWLTTRYSAGYLENYYGVDRDNIMMIKEGDVAVGSIQYKQIYQNMVSDITNSDMTDPEEYERAGELIDLDSYIDYYATQIYIARCGDWPISNFALWRTCEVRDDKYSDGKWRWMLFDSNSGSMRISLLQDNTLEETKDNDPMFASLWENVSFRKQFKKRIFEIADQCFAPEEMEAYIENFRVTMKPHMAKSWARFYGSDNNVNSDFNYIMYSHKKFFNERRAVVESWFK